ncbi:MAG: tRNA (cytidine(34)-2'-O)-methyltransferase [Phycisphaerae bacterium]|nr:tRNA (cytidine(34)-2'-O)-methyltransferase [Phycisphaerae bacterium]
MTEPLLNLVLYQPQIPNNTGNIGRTAATTGCRLHLIHPLGFSMDEKARRRAGLDYWHLVDCREHASWESFLNSESPRRMWLYTTGASRPHWEADFTRGDYLIFGQENGGLPSRVHRWVVERFGDRHLINLPMRPVQGARSLNLATAVACAVYEGMRQLAAGGAPLWDADPGKLHGEVRGTPG